jgi:DNA polymerase-3 subunit alpha
MEQIPRFIKAKHGLEPIKYPHPALAEILKETYGVIVYQEQVLFIVQAFAGYSLGQADIFRKAMGKKITEVMKKEKRNFVTGARKKGFSTEVADEVFALIEPFAGYAFNKAHAVSYARVAYQTAYLKANYPVEYMTALLSAHVDQSEKIATAVADCRRLGIQVLRPDINRSQVNFSIEKPADGSQAIRFGLSAIKNVGPGAIEPVIHERRARGEYKSIEDLCRRADLASVNKRVMESLIMAGALDSLGDRGTLLNNVSRILSLAQREQRLRQTGQSTMFDLWGKTVDTPLPSLDMVAADVSIKQKLDWEKELLGVYLSEHPFSPFANKAVSENTVLCGQVDAEMEGKALSVAGMVASVHNLLTRDGQPSASIILEDLDGQLEVMVWPRVYASHKELLQEGNVLLVVGKVRLRGDRVQLVCENAWPYRLEEPKAKVMPAQPIEAPALKEPEPAILGARRLVISLSQTSDETQDRAILHRIRAVLRDFPGEDEVSLNVANESKVFKLRLPGVRISYCPELHRRLVELVGEESIAVEKIGG